MSDQCCSNISIFLLLLTSWISCIFCSIFNIIKFILSVGGFWDLLTDACDATIIGVSGSFRALCLCVSSLSVRRLLLRVLEGLGGSDGNDKEGRLSRRRLDGLG
jgi:hypothetical protein